MCRCDGHHGGLAGEDRCLDDGRRDGHWGLGGRDQSGGEWGQQGEGAVGQPQQAGEQAGELVRELGQGRDCELHDEGLCELHDVGRCELHDVELSELHVLDHALHVLHVTSHVQVHCELHVLEPDVLCGELERWV